MLERRILHLTKAFLKDLSHDWTVAEMAAMFDLTTPHVTKLCRSETGFPPQTYLRNLRLQRFHEILLEGYSPINVIGARVGLLDETHLTRDYKTKFGVTPTQARVNQAEMEQSKPPVGEK